MSDGASMAGSRPTAESCAHVRCRRVSLGYGRSVHDDRELAERRIDRELWERVLPLVHVDRTALDVTSGPTPDAQESFEVGSEWGAPWGTTWFRLTGDVPDSWRSRQRTTRIEAVVDLGFNRSPAGFQAEGLVVAHRPDGSFEPLQGIHPRRTNYVIDRESTTVDLLVEAASNPTFPQFAPSRQGLPETASTDPIYRFRTADLVLVDQNPLHNLKVLYGNGAVKLNDETEQERNAGRTIDFMCHPPSPPQLRRFSIQSLSTAFLRRSR